MFMPVKNPFTKKEVRVQTAKIKTPKLLEFQTKRITNLLEQKLKNNWLKLHKNKLKVSKKYPHQFFDAKVRDLWCDWLICEIMCTVCGERKRKIVAWNLKAKEIFYNANSLQYKYI